MRPSTASLLLILVISFSVAVFPFSAKQRHVLTDTAQDSSAVSARQALPTDIPLCLVNMEPWTESKITATLTQNYASQTSLARYTNKKTFTFTQAGTATDQCGLIIVFGSANEKHITDVTNGNSVIWDTMRITLQGPVFFEACRCQVQKLPRVLAARTVFCTNGVVVPRLGADYSVWVLPANGGRNPIHNGLKGHLECFGKVTNAKSVREMLQHFPRFVSVVRLDSEWHDEFQKKMLQEPACKDMKLADVITTVRCKIGHNHIHNILEQVPLMNLPDAALQRSSLFGGIADYLRHHDSKALGKASLHDDHNVVKLTYETFAASGWSASGFSNDMDMQLSIEPDDCGYLGDDNIFSLLEYEGLRKIYE